MKRAGIARKKTKDTSKAVSPKRVKQIQKVFDQLGIGDEASRRSVTGVR